MPMFLVLERLFLPKAYWDPDLLIIIVDVSNNIFVPYLITPTVVLDEI